MIHRLSDVQTNKIGEGTRVWQFCVILEGATLGDYCNICSNVFIENKVVIGNNVTIKNGVQLWDGVRLEDGVFIGPNVTFLNDKNPRSGNVNFELLETEIKKSASVGGNSTILPGITIGEYAMIGAGSIVTRDVPNHSLFVGTPARFKAWINKDGSKMSHIESNIYQDSNGNKWEDVNSELLLIS